jgi:hypothetical protein
MEINTSKFKKGAPKCEGRYFHLSRFGGVDFVTLRFRTLLFLKETYLGVDEYGGKSVDRYDKDLWSDKIEFI